MISLFSRIIPVIITLLAGVGTGEIMDKVAADKIPGYVNPYKNETGVNWNRVLWTGITVAIGTIIAAYVVKKLRLRIKI